MFEKNTPDSVDNGNNANNNDNREEIPVIIHKKKLDFASYSNRYYYSPEDGYHKLAQDEAKQVYRWSLEDEEHRRQLNKAESRINNSRNAKRGRGKSVGLKIFAAAMSAMFVLSATFSSFLVWEHLSGEANPNTGSSFDQLTISAPSSDSGRTADEFTVSVNGSVSDVIERVRPSVVSIQAEIEVPRSTFWGRGGAPFTQVGVGTGFVLTESGYIATNYHVIEGAAAITVLMYNGRSYPATLVGGDAAADIAIVRISARNLIPAELGDSNAMREGDFVVAIGSPGGLEFAGSSTFGIVSGINRDIEVSRGRNMTLLQHDAAINPGNSGGPLVNMSGQVIGINTLKLASNFFSGHNYEGMGFAIPITLAVEQLNDIIANPGADRTPRIGYDERDTSEVSFGISGGTVTEAAAERYGVPRGFQVGRVIPEGSSDRAGIEAWDIITALDGATVESFEDLIELKNNYQPGDEAVITVYRDGEILDLTIIFDAMVR